MIKKFILTILFCLIPLIAFSQDKEILSQRTYNQKVYDLGKDARGRQRKNYKIHTAHIHYKDGSDFKDIDTTLIKDTNGWHQEKASYHCQIPEYSDDWFEFYNAFEGVNHTIQAKPIAEHIKGEYFKDKGQGVIYKDSFGKGIDLKVYAYWAGLKKVIIINEKPADISEDLTFDFELELPVSNIKNKDKNGKDFITSDIQVKDSKGNKWDKTSKLDFKDKTLKIGDYGKESYFRNAMVWDSKGPRGVNQPVDIELYKQGNEIYLRKTITKDILDKAIYPLYTDHPTSYYVGAGDGYVSMATTTWNGVHDAISGTSSSATDEATSCQTEKSGSFYFMTRVFLPIDTSALDDSAVIDSATLNLYVTDKINTEDDGDDFINVVGPTTQADPAGLVLEDFDQCGGVNRPTEGATRIDIGDITTLAYNAWTLNENGLSWIKKTAGDPYTMLGLREGHDIRDSSPTSGWNQIIVSTSEDTSGTQDPYLDVTTSEGAERRIIFIQ